MEESELTESLMELASHIAYQAKSELVNTTEACYFLCDGTSRHGSYFSEGSYRRACYPHHDDPCPCIDLTVNGTYFEVNNKKQSLKDIMDMYHYEWFAFADTKFNPFKCYDDQIIGLVSGFISQYRLYTFCVK
jgi:hypothetical protein